MRPVRRRVAYDSDVVERERQRLAQPGVADADEQVELLSRDRRFDPVKDRPARCLAAAPDGDGAPPRVARWSRRAPGIAPTS